MRFILLYIILLSFGVRAQKTVSYTVFNEANSTIGSDVNYNVHQTPDGIVYVSGNAGLQRFDGKRFYSYPKEGKGIAISSSNHDHTGRLWANTFHGDIYYLKNDSLIRHPVSEEIKGLSRFYRLSNGFYIVTYQDVFLLDDAALTFQKKPNVSNPVMSVNSIDNSDYSFYFKTEDYVDLDNDQKKKLDDRFILFTDCLPIQVGKDSYNYHKVENLLYNMRSTIDGVPRAPISLPYVGKVNFADCIDGQFYICGMNGIRIYDQKGQLLHDILPKVQVTRVIKDIEGNLLVSSASHGLLIITDLNIYNYQYDNYLDEEIIIRSTKGPEGTLYLGTNAGLVLKHDLQNNTIDTIRVSQRSEITALYFDTIRDQLYVFSDRLFIIDIVTHQVLKSYKTSAIKQVCANESEVALGSRSRVLRLRNDSIRHIKDCGWSISLTNFDENSFIASTKKGLFYIDSSFAVKSVQFKGIDRISNIQTVRRSKNARIFFLNNNQEIYELLGLEKEPKLIYALSTRSIQSLDLSEHGILSIEDDGVKLIDMDSGTLLKSINKLNGLGELSTINVLELVDRKVFVHNSSITIYDDLPEKSSVKPLIHILSLNGTFQEGRDGFSSPYASNLLTVKLHVANVIRSQGTYKLKYRIKGLGEKWSPLFSSNDEYEFARLPIGQQVIQFKAFNENNIASEIVEVSVTVVPPFYLSTWFLILVVLVFIFLIVLIVRYYVRKANKRMSEKLKQQKLETRAMNAELTAIRSQMNPHFIFNVLTAIQSKVIEGSTDEAYDNIGDFARLIRNVLDKSGKPFLLLKEELALISNYVKLENTRFDPSIELSITVTDEAYFEDVEIPTLITQPFVENSIKHAFSKSPRARILSITVDRFPKGFYILIKDNGTGIKDKTSNDKDHKSFAMEAMNRRIKNLKMVSKYDVDLVISSDSMGTEIKLIFTWKNN